MDSPLLDAMAREGFELVLALHDRASGLQGFLALHDTSSGVALGGIRRWRYRDEREALGDCLRLSRAMTHKCVLAGLPLGGGKLVLLDRPGVDWERAYEHVGRTVELLGGRFEAGPDLGTGPEELAWVARHTAHVTQPGPTGPGELPEATAAGVLEGMAAALRRLDGEEDWSRRTVVVQGLGSVGRRLAQRLVERGVRVIGTDVLSGRAREVAAALGIETLPAARELDQPCDLLAPCALGGILHDLSIARLRCRAVAGAANNVLARPEHADQLHERGVLLVPDVAITSGALLRGAIFQLEGRREAPDVIGARIGATVARILSLAAEADLPPERVAFEEAERELLHRRERGNAVFEAPLLAALPVGGEATVTRSRP